MNKRQAILIWFTALITIICLTLFPIWWGFTRLGIVLV